MSVIFMKRLIFVLLLMTCSVSWAEWERLGETANYVHFANKKTIRKKGNFVEMWDMKNYFETKVSDGKNYKSIKVLNRYDCKDATRGIVSYYYYAKENGEGGTVDYTVKKMNEINDEPIVPDSAGEVLWKIACGRE